MPPLSFFLLRNSDAAPWLSDWLPNAVLDGKYAFPERTGFVQSVRLELHKWHLQELKAG
jgi:hypothetical protein